MFNIPTEGVARWRRRDRAELNEPSREGHGFRAWLFGAFLLLTVLSGGATSRASDIIDDTLRSLAHYQPAPFTVPEGAAYVDAIGGAITIMGYNDMGEMLESLNALFAAAHPGFKFRLTLKGTATGAPALMHGKSAFAPMGAEFSAIESIPYRFVVGQDPFAIRVAHCSLNARGKSALATANLPPGAEKPTGDAAAPIGIFVNEANPLSRLTIGQVARIFSSGTPGGDITHWGQLGLKGEWARRSIHPCGVEEQAAAGIAAEMLKHHLAGRPFPPDFDAYPQSLEVINRIIEDRSAIGFASGNLVRPGVKAVALAEKEDGYYSSLNIGDIVTGKYPLNRYLYFYVRRVSGQPFDPFVKEYLRLVLSQEGQRAIAEAPPGYLPLNASEVAEELAKLQ
ncbi:MAG: substrate-binding domain-containing protein [Opitutaceae bacterium]|nr:substrate-binding domain-containing protein [Opitutaceae bacterium]